MVAIRFFIFILFFHYLTLLANPPLKEINYALPQNIDTQKLNVLKEMVAVEENVEEEAWPRFKFYKIIRAKPLEAIAVFGDFVFQKEYVPNMTEAEIVKVEKFNSIWVSYKMKTPWPTPNAAYTTRNILWADGKGAYSVEWNLIESNLCKSTNGMARFIPYKESETLFIYENHISPNLPLLAKHFKSKALSDARETVEAIVKKIEEVVKGDSARLSRQLKLISPILLNGEDSYSPLLSPKNHSPSH